MQAEVDEIPAIDEPMGSRREEDGNNPQKVLHGLLIWVYEQFSAVSENTSRFYYSPCRMPFSESSSQWKVCLAITGQNPVGSRKTAQLSVLFRNVI